VKFSVSNLGRIRQAEIDIKPLTVFVGKANTNKTWTAYALYGVLRSLARGVRPAVFSKPRLHCPQLDSAIEQIAQRVTDQTTAFFTSPDRRQNSSARDESESFVSEVSRSEIVELAGLNSPSIGFSLHEEDIASILAVEPSIVRNARVRFELPTEQFKEVGKVQSAVFIWAGQYWMVTGVLRNGQPIHRTAFAASPNSSESDALKEHVISSLCWLTESIFDDAMAFPSERKGLSALLGSIDFPRRELTLNQPSNDYLAFLSQAQRISKQTSSASRSFKVLDLLEQNVMNGKADFHGNADARMFGFTGTQGPTVHMNASASFVRSLAGLDLYLRTTANYDVIVIDEPEMNAHPEAQIKLVELFAIMANLGKHVIVTTHSPYFVDHLNNLISGSSLSADAKEALAGNLRLKDSSAFISPDMAGAYLFEEDGTVRSLVEDGSIDVSGFASETDYLSNIYSQIRDYHRAE
jgi:hypothetical protein